MPVRDPFSRMDQEELAEADLNEEIERTLTLMEPRCKNCIEIKRDFEPFYTTKLEGQGTGLGLSLTHGIIERHAGRIWVESASGLGTRFVIELPLRGAVQITPV